MASTRAITLNNGQRLPRLGLGTSTWTWENPRDQVYTAVRDAINCGYRHVDTAEYYNTETDVGRAVNDCIADGTVGREDVVVVTKVARTHMDPVATAKAFRESVKRLNLDIDVYLIHHPMALDESLGYTRELHDLFERGLFAKTDYIDTWKAMERLVAEGQVKSIGVSNFNIQQIQRILDLGLTKPVCNQVEVSPYCQNRDLIKYCLGKDIAVVACCSLGSPARTTIMSEDLVLLEEPNVLEVAARQFKTPAQVLLRWAIQKGCCIIPKSSTERRIQENAQVFDFELSDADMLLLDDIKHTQRCCSFPESIKHPHYPFHGE